MDKEPPNVETLINRDEQLRELLSYCRRSAENLNLDDLSDEFNPYDDVAYRLGQILDGES